MKDPRPGDLVTFRSDDGGLHRGVCESIVLRSQRPGGVMARAVYAVRLPKIDDPIDVSEPSLVSVRHPPRQLSYEEAVLKYLASGARYSARLGGPPQPNWNLSYRNPKDTGWILNNIHGYLAYVPDVGGVLA